jgi:hypothetical protein
MVTKSIMFCLSLFIVEQIKGQAVYIELLGKGLVNSVNYEHSLSRTVQGFNVQIGAGFAPTSLVTVPASVNYVFGSNKHHFELGVGITYINGFLWADDDSFGPDFGIHTILLYRFEKPGRKFFFKAGATPFISRNLNIGPWFGAGIGFRFRSKQ